MFSLGGLRRYFPLVQASMILSISTRLCEVRTCDPAPVSPFILHVQLHGNWLQAALDPLWNCNSRHCSASKKGTQKNKKKSRRACECGHSCSNVAILPRVAYGGRSPASRSSGHSWHRPSLVAPPINVPQILKRGCIRLLSHPIVENVLCT